MRAIIFDIDGTLLQSNAVDDAIYRQSVRAVLGPVSFRESLHDYDAVTDSGILTQVFSDNRLTLKSHIFDAVKREFQRRTQLHIDSNGPFSEIPGARDAFSRLCASSEHRIAIATGGWRFTAEIKLETAGFDIAGLPLATSDDADERPEIMQFALNSIGAPVDSVTYYGDGEWDRAACRLLGWSFVAVGPALRGIASYDDAFRE